MPRPDLIPSRGAISEPLHIEVIRDLTAADILRLGDAPKVGPPAIQKLRATHHRQAVLLAEGRSVAEVAAIVGCTPQRLTQLQADPTFVELIGHYKDQVISAMLMDAARLKDKIVDLGEMAVDEMRERMDDEARRRGISIGEIRKIAEFAMDRTVAPPQLAPNAPLIPPSITISFGTSLRPDRALASGAEVAFGAAARVPTIEHEDDMPLAQVPPTTEE